MNIFRTNKSGSKVMKIKDFSLPNLRRKRDLWVYLPPDYEINLTKHFPVLYCNDGQNLFTDSGCGCWHVDKHLDDLYRKEKRSIIAIGIENSDKHRDTEYLPWEEGDKYALDWREAIYPFINKTLRTKQSRNFTGFAGSSLGATILLEFLNSHQDLISHYSFFSPAVEVQFERTLDFAEDIKFTHFCKMYFDIGSMEGSSQGDEELDDEEYIFRANEIATLLHEHSDLPSLFVLDTKHKKHCEQAWSARFLLSVDWMINKSDFLTDSEHDHELII